LFMGCEFAQTTEWNVDHSLSWHLLDHASHAGVQQWVKDLNDMYRNESALYEINYSPEGYYLIFRQ